MAAVGEPGPGHHGPLPTARFSYTPAGAPSPTPHGVTIGPGNQEQPQQPATPADAPEPSDSSPGVPSWSPLHRRGARLRLAEKPAPSHSRARPGQGAGLRPQGAEPRPPEVP